MPWKKLSGRWLTDGRVVVPAVAVVFSLTVALSVWRGVPWWAGPAGFLGGLVAVPVAEGVNALIERLQRHA